MARRAASRCASDMPSSSHSSGLAWPTDQATHQPAIAVEQRLALALGEHLGVADLVDAAVPREDRRADRQRARPRAPADLVDADDDLVALVPQLAARTPATATCA